MPRGSRWATTFKVLLGQGDSADKPTLPSLKADANAPTTYRQARPICPWAEGPFEPESLDLVDEASPLRLHFARIQKHP